jgi:hypothetical protein
MSTEDLFSREHRNGHGHAPPDEYVTDGLDALGLVPTWRRCHARS